MNECTSYERGWWAMEKVSKRQQSVLDVLDVQIETLERQLQKVQPLIDELSNLKRARAALLNERGTTGGIRNTTRLTMEEVIHAMGDESWTPNDLATRLSVDVNTVRSHLNRYKDERYAKNGDNTWRLIGEGIEDDEGEEDDE